MSNTGKFKDRAPFLRVAGITSTVFGNSADQSLRQDLYYKVNKQFILYELYLNITFQNK